MSRVRIGEDIFMMPKLDSDVGQNIVVSLAPEEIIIALDSPPKISAQNVAFAKIASIKPSGPNVLIELDIGTRIIAEITRNALLDLELSEGQDVYIIIKGESINPISGVGDF